MWLKKENKFFTFGNIIGRRTEWRKENMKLVLLKSTYIPPSLVLFLASLCLCLCLSLSQELTFVPDHVIFSSLYLLFFLPSFLPSFFSSFHPPLFSSFFFFICSLGLFHFLFFQVLQTGILRMFLLSQGFELVQKTK